MKAFGALAVCVLAACSAPVRGPDIVPVRIDVPAARGFVASRPAPPLRANADMAQDFLDLTFQMESGRPLPVLTRFEGPVTLRVIGLVPPSLPDDLDALLARLRREADIPISLTTSPDARITIEAVPSLALRQIAPDAACFVVPRISDWTGLRAARGSDRLDWATLTTRDRAAIFLPADAAPQEIRDCLHEELAQALGPLNDLYRLPDSVFNDDNFHAVLTGFDMLMLRATYARELSSGMDRASVAAALPALLARLNPQGGGIAAAPATTTPRAWQRAIVTALSTGASDGQRRRAVARAQAISAAEGWVDVRAGFTQYVAGRLALGRDSAQALDAFNTAAGLFAGDRNTAIHSAHLAAQLAGFTLAAGDARATLALTRPAIATARRYQNAALAAVLMQIEAEALTLAGDPAAGMALRLDSLGLARYGFGSRQAVIDQLNAIAALTPRPPS